MKPLSLLTLAALLLSAPVRADALPPERLLSAGTQVYLRWDGVAAHREAYRQVTVGKLLQGDLAPFTKAILDQFPKLLRSGFTDAKLLDGESPEKLSRINADVNEAGKLIDVLAEYGVVAGLEVSGLPSLWEMAVGGVQSALGKKPERNPFLPRVQFTLILPGAAARSAPVFSLVRLFAVSQNLEAKQDQIAGRSVVSYAEGETHWFVWVEGPHVVVVVSTEPPAAVLTRLTGPAPRLESHPLYRRVKEFDKFSTDVRGFVDIRSLSDLARRALMLADASTVRKLEALGVWDVRSLVYYTGFDGPVRREVIEIDAPGPRRGLLRVAGGQALGWDRLPPLPPDVGKWSAHRLDLATLFDLGMQAFDLIEPQESGTPAEPAAERLDKVLGINVKTDLIEQLGDLVVAYHSPSDAAFSLGQVLVVEVKDAERTLAALDQIVQSFAGGKVQLKKRPFGDAEIREVRVRENGFIFVPSYAVHKNWLVLSVYPQPVQGFLRRSTGDAKAWEADDGTKALFAALPRNSTGWGYNDPRPGATQLLTFGSLLVEVTQSFGQDLSLDTGTLPSASVLTQRLTPNVTSFRDDGHTLRWDARGGLLLPLDSIGVDPLILFIAAQLVG
jgi:hypothetical protein